MTTKAKAKAQDKPQPDLDPIDEAKAAADDDMTVAEPIEPKCGRCHTPIGVDEETGEAPNTITGEVVIAHQHCADTAR